MKNLEIGKIGENIAYKYLINNNYVILSRNHRERFFEIDIIARHGDGTLIFFEVKTLNNSDELMPEDNLSPRKYIKLIRAAGVFLMRNPNLIREDRGWQINLVAVELKNGKFAELRHYKNI